MGLYNFFKKAQGVQGDIGYFGLSEWWLSEFSEEERNYIVKTFQPLGSIRDSLVKGTIAYTSGTVIGLLSSLAGWFNKKEDRTIAYRIIKKAEELINEQSDILDIHFLFQSKIEVYYRNRDDDPNALEEAIKACKQQIEIAPKAAVAFKKEYGDATLPSHKGFEQLAIIEEKQKNFEATINISQKALEQGWAGGWQKRIERCRKKLNKSCI
jgi:tetratricopeptide (TPR) repeat protein